MKLSHLAERSPAPTPWSEGDKIPWHEPGFSRRMLAEHLSQAHDRASRRFEILDGQVAWIHEQILAGQPARVLDLGCGPGLYAERLVGLGHQVVGVDISPASIAHAREHVGEATFVEADIRQVELAGFDSFSLAMLLFGEANAFRRRDLETILSKAAAALEPGGALILEPHSFAAVHRIGCQSPTWYSAPHGLFADEPYICLHESFWDDASATATERWWVIDSNTADVTRHVGTLQAYGEDDYRSLLENAGFEKIAQQDGLGVAQEGLFALVARKSS
ncbi:MAG: methyltransferase domain-containing protein [Myxococcota bacterium]|nr:methyltransferase domain-containing protein [Myxococcota bacterium]